MNNFTFTLAVQAPSKQQIITKLNVAMFSIEVFVNVTLVCVHDYV